MIKIQYLKQIHIVALQSSFSILKQRLKAIFKALPSSLSFSYLDEEGDKINLDSDQDYQIFLEQAQHHRSKKLSKLEISALQEQFAQKLDSSVEEVMQPIDGDSSIEILNDVSHLSEVSFDYERNEDVEDTQDIIDDEIFLDYTEELQVGEFVQENSFLGNNYLEEDKQDISMRQKEQNPQIISEQVNNYLENTYSILQEVVFSQIKYVDKLTQKSGSKIHIQQEQLYELIQLSLQKLLPNYMNKIAMKTSQNISLIIKNRIQESTDLYQ